MKYTNLNLSDKLSLYDSDLQKISYYKENHIVYAKVLIKLSYPNNYYVELLFIDVKECSFFWDMNYDFYTIDSYKLLKTEDSIYFSLDPVDREMFISNDDRGIIRSKKIKGYYFLDNNNKKEFIFSESGETQ